MITQLHINDRKAAAATLQVSIERFDSLLQSANHAYEFITAMGPFYGKEEVKEPTFRITAEPVRLPVGAKKQLTQLGNDLLYLGRALPKLSENIKQQVGTNLDFRVPLSWRVDCIIDEQNQIHMNEIEGKDGASALMVIEQLAYGLQLAHQTTVGRFISALNNINPYTSATSVLKIAILRTDIHNDNYILNTHRFIELISELSKGTIQCDLLDLNEQYSAPDWSGYSAIFNETFFSPKELMARNIPIQNLYAAGNFDALANKNIFALVHEDAYTKFWQKNIGSERLARLRRIMIPTYFVKSKEDIARAKEQGRVVKVAWANDDLMLINRSKGVAVPISGITQGNQDRWDDIYSWYSKGYSIIQQDYVEPKRIDAFLRKKGTNLESVSWYNRLCIKYVCDGNPNGEFIPNVFLTAAEVTLGPNIIPAGRECAFTAATF